MIYGHVTCTWEALRVKEHLVLHSYNVIASLKGTQLILSIDPNVGIPSMLSHFIESG